MMRYMYLKFVPARIQARPQVELEIRILEVYFLCIADMYRECTLGIGRSCLKPGGGDLSHADT